MLPSTQTVPNFFIVGAPKAGTTSLYHWLAAHPQVFMSPIKEPSYFSLEARPENFVPEYQANMRQQMSEVQSALRCGLGQSLRHGVVGEWEDYLRLFTGAEGKIAVGEASVFYLWSKTAAQHIAERTPHARILLILRDPSERAFSQYLHYVSLGHIGTSFRQHILAGMNPGEELGIYQPFLEIGHYAEHLERYFAAFPREQIRIWLYEDTLSEPQTFRRQVMEFLNVDSGFAPDVSKRHLEVLVPKMLGVTQAMRRKGLWGKLRDSTPASLRPLFRKIAYRHRRTVRLAPEDRKILIDYYKDDIHKLQHILGRDLSAWLK